MFSFVENPRKPVKTSILSIARDDANMRYGFSQITQKVKGLELINVISVNINLGIAVILSP